MFRERVRLKRPQKRGRAPTFRQLRYSRAQTQELLGVSESTLLRMERRGELTPIRRTPTSWVYYSREEVMAAAAQGSAHD